MGEAEGGHRQQAGDQGETGQGRGAHDAMRSQHGLVVDMKTSGRRPAQVCGRGGARRGLTTRRSSSQELPEKWNNVKKMAVTVRQQVAPLQANEVALLRQRCSAFDLEQQQFCEQFRREAPFRYRPTPFFSAWQSLGNGGSLG